jgi:hypothetical protein
MRSLQLGINKVYWVRILALSAPEACLFNVTFRMHLQFQASSLGCALYESLY